MYLRLFNREEKPCRREGSWQVQAVITDQRPSRVITDRETVDQLKSRTPQSVVMRPHTHDGPIGCCAVKPSLSSFTYSRGSRWPCGSPCGVGGASYPGHSAASCPLLSGKLRDLARAAYLPSKVIPSLSSAPPETPVSRSRQSCTCSTAHVTLYLRICEKVVFRPALHTSHGYWRLIPTPTPPSPPSRFIFIL